MKKILYLQALLTLGILTAAPGLMGQRIGIDDYWIYFTDKQNNGYSISDPLAFLSQRSVDRRAWQGLGIDATDLPVRADYVNEVEALGVRVKHVSRWLNGAALEDISPERFEEVLALPFVDTLPWEPVEDRIYLPPTPEGHRFEYPLTSETSLSYGYSWAQIRQMEIQDLHEMGYTGKGVWIGVLDAGFRNVDSLPAFQSMIEEGRLMGTRNFVHEGSVFRMASRHGMYVLSIIGGLLDGVLMGTAPHASFYLCATEDIFSETIMEEVAWISGAEYLDSLGMDVFNTSLGYHDFDSTLFDYRYEDLDGQTALISRAASRLASKGIIACNSAGNEGNNSWYRIIAPADAEGILSTGAVDSTGVIASFSSRGPSFDGRIKPDLMAMGYKTALQHWNGGPGRGSGTSFSSPVLAGAMASLWQAFPTMSARDLIQEITATGDRYLSPDEHYGYGIPDFSQALQRIRSHRATSMGGLTIFPNPATQSVHILLPGDYTGTATLEFYSLNGIMIHSVIQELPGILELPSWIPSGLYVIRVRTKNLVFTDRIQIR